MWDIQEMLAMERSVMQSLSSIWKSKDISTLTKVRLLKALLCSFAVYGCECWIFLSKDEKYIEALKCGATEDFWEFHGRNTRQMNGY